MAKHAGALVLTAATAALAFAMGAAPSAVATAIATWTIDPGGSFSGTASDPVLKDLNTGSTFTCATVTLTGTFDSGSGQANPIGKITADTWTSCTGPRGVRLDMTDGGSVPWHMNANTYTASTGTTHGTMAIAVDPINGACVAAFIGTVNWAYTNSTHVLKITGSLDVDRAICPTGWVKPGDEVTVTVSAPLSPAMTITSP
jgi:hypothetical protein